MTTVAFITVAETVAFLAGVTVATIVGYYVRRWLDRHEGEETPLEGP